jgi:hypothetical protein
MVSKQVLIKITHSQVHQPRPQAPTQTREFVARRADASSGRRKSKRLGTRLYKKSLVHPMYCMKRFDGPLNSRIKRFHSFPRDQLDKSHGGHVGVPDKSLIKIILNWNTNMAAVTSCANAPE